VPWAPPERVAFVGTVDARTHTHTLAIRPSKLFFEIADCATNAEKKNRARQCVSVRTKKKIISRDDDTPLSLAARRPNIRMDHEFSKRRDADADRVLADIDAVVAAHQAAVEPVALYVTGSVALHRAVGDRESWRFSDIDLLATNVTGGIAGAAAGVPKMVPQVATNVAADDVTQVVERLGRTCAKLGGRFSATRYLRGDAATEEDAAGERHAMRDLVAKTKCQLPLSPPPVGLLRSPPPPKPWSPLRKPRTGKVSSVEPPSSLPPPSWSSPRAPRTVNVALSDASLEHHLRNAKEPARVAYSARDPHVILAPNTAWLRNARQRKLIGEDASDLETRFKYVPRGWMATGVGDKAICGGGGGGGGDDDGRPIERKVTEGGSSGRCRDENEIKSCEAGPAARLAKRPSWPAKQPTGPAKQPTGPTKQPTGPTKQPTGLTNRPAGPAKRRTTQRTQALAASLPVMEGTTPSDTLLKISADHQWRAKLTAKIHYRTGAAWRNVRIAQGVLASGALAGCAYALLPPRPANRPRGFRLAIFAAALAFAPCLGAALPATGRERAHQRAGSDYRHLGDDWKLLSAYLAAGAIRPDKAHVHASVLLDRGRQLDRLHPNAPELFKAGVVADIAPRPR
jgi:hypothetical protein